MPPLKINSKLLPMKIHYFLFSAGTAPILLFGSVISKQLGYTAVTVGFIYTLIPLFVFVLKPLICACADKYKQRRKLYFLTLALCLISTISFVLIPARQLEASVNLSCHKVTEIVSCDNSIDTAAYRTEFHELRQQEKNDRIVCELSCQSTPHLMEELCQVWKVSQYCSSTSSASTNSLPISGKNNVLEKPGKTSVVKPTVYTSSSAIPRVFNFQALITLHYSSVINNCVYSRIKAATFHQTTKDTSTSLSCSTKLMLSTKCKMRCLDNVAVMELFIPTERNIFSRYEFWLLFFLILLNWVSMAVNTSISDTVCFHLLGEEGHKYGQTRLFGSLGWGLSSFFFGWVIDHYSGNSEVKNYFSAYLTGSLFLLLNILIGLTIRIEQKNYSLSIGKDVCKLFTDVRIVIFTLCCFYVGVCSGMVWSFLFWHLEDISTPEEKLWSKTLQGLDAVFSSVLGELPFFFISGYIIRKCGHVHSMSLVLLAFSFRLLLYSALTRPAWVLPIELLNGFTYGIFYAVMTSYASVVAPHGAEATAQGVFGASFDCFGNSLGSLIGGFIYEKYKGAVLYGIFGWLTLLVCCLHIVLQRFITQRNPGPSIKGTSSSVSYATPNEACNMLQSQY